MKVPFFDLKREYRNLENEIDDAVKRVLKSGRYIQGNEAGKFEREFSSYTGAEFCIGVNSGTDALLAAVGALGIGPGDEVITVSHTFISTADAIVRWGATPVFVDIDETTYCMDTTNLEQAITDKTKAILPVHLYGHPADIDPIIDLAERYGLSVVEDACQAHGAEYKGKKVGVLGDIGCFSFYPAKNLGAYGDAGVIVTNNGGVAEKARALCNYGQYRRSWHDLVGFNSRMDEIQAAVLGVKIRYLDEWNARRRKLAEVYLDGLAATDLVLPREETYATHVYHQFAVRYSDRDAITSFLSDRGIQTLVHYPVPVHRQKPYLQPEAKTLPRTDRVCDEVFSLPMNPWMKDDEVESVIDGLVSFVETKE